MAPIKHKSSWDLFAAQWKFSVVSPQAPPAGQLVFATRFQAAFPIQWWQEDPVTWSWKQEVQPATSTQHYSETADSSNWTPEQGLRIDLLDTMVWRLFFVTLLLALLGSMTGLESVSGEYIYHLYVTVKTSVSCCYDANQNSLLSRHRLHLNCDFN